MDLSGIRVQMGPKPYQRQETVKITMAVISRHGIMSQFATDLALRCCMRRSAW